MRLPIRHRLLAAASVFIVYGAAATVANAAPTASTPPIITGKAAYGSTLTCTNGTWSAGAGSFVYTWELADGNVAVGTGATLRVRASWVGSAIVCAVTGKDTTGTATATSAPVTAAPQAASVTVTSAREISTATRKVRFAGRISPTASLAGGTGSLILYRKTRTGLQQLSFNGNQTRPARNGSFVLETTGEPTGTNTYVVQYVPSALGYGRSTVTRRVKVTG